jgi:hypothetical protein
MSRRASFWKGRHRRGAVETTAVAVVAEGWASLMGDMGLDECICSQPFWPQAFSALAEAWSHCCSRALLSGLVDHISPCMGRARGACLT